MISSLFRSLCCVDTYYVLGKLIPVCWVSGVLIPMCWVSARYVDNLLCAGYLGFQVYRLRYKITVTVHMEASGDCAGQSDWINLYKICC